ncbi:SET and MYND domain-containing protein 4-like [Phlebotomus papatasi]|nr:SET and MYND domain-containing protein 4-like [Phlebotomus papatasi]
MPENNKWDLFIGLFIDKKDIFKREILVYQSELITVQQLYQVPVVRQLFSRWIQSLAVSNKRNEDQSKMFRERGNELYKSKPPKYKEAIEFYTKAIYHAPSNSVELALAHANRAVALMAVKYFQEAYDDCEMAVKFSYPKENILKVLFRLAACSAELRDRNLLQKDIKSIENELKNHKNHNPHIKKLMEYKTKLQDLKKFVEEFKQQQKLPSKNIVEKYTDEQGRYMTAGEKIKRDDVIMSERAFAFVPVYENYPDDTIDTDCQNCAKVNIVSFPCYECYKATYCSTKCRKDHEAIHSVECFGYKRNLWYYIGIAHLSVRTFLSGFPELVERLENDTTITTLPELWRKTLDLCNDESFRYGRVLRLVSNFEKMSESTDFIRYSLTATMLTVYLRENTKFFDQLPPVCEKILENRYNWEIFVGSLIMLHMGQLVSNGHSITDLRTTLASEIDCLDSHNMMVKVGKLHCYVRSTRIFTGIFPRISMLNHSCNPNVRNNFDRDQLTLSATRPIAKEAEIFNCYGPSFKLMSTVDRRKGLREQYCFECSCEKCIQEPEDRSYHQYYICEKCKNKIYIDESKNFWWRNLELKPKIDCESCGLRVNFSWFKLFMSHLGEIESEGKVSNSFGKVCDIYALTDKTMGIHNELRQDVGIMILCHFIPFLSSYVSFNEKLMQIATELLKLREEKFGIYSIEFIIASTYLLDLMALQRKLNLKTNTDYSVSHIRKAFQILSKDTQAILNSYINCNIVNCTSDK